MLLCSCYGVLFLVCCYAKFVLKTLMIVYILQLVKQSFAVTFLSDFQSFLPWWIIGNNPINHFEGDNQAISRDQNITPQILKSWRF